MNATAIQMTVVPCAADHAIANLQNMLNKLVKWGKTCGLHFNSEKSVAIVFTRRRKLPPKHLMTDGKPVPYRKSVKYLCVTLDSKLHWTEHITNKIKKTKRYLIHVANITRNNWGPKPKLMCWAFTSVVRPMLCYGSMIWGHRAPAQEAKLRRVNRMAMNTFSNFPKSTPTRRLEIMLDVSPLHLHCLHKGLAALIRLDKNTTLDWSGRTCNITHAMLSATSVTGKTI